MTKVTLGLQNYWRMANGEVGIVPRDLTLAGIRSYPLLGRRRGWHYNRAQYSGGALFIQSTTSQIYSKIIFKIKLFD